MISIYDHRRTSLLKSTNVATQIDRKLSPWDLALAMALLFRAVAAPAVCASAAYRLQSTILYCLYLYQRHLLLQYCTGVRASEFEYHANPLPVVEKCARSGENTSRKKSVANLNCHPRNCSRFLESILMRQ